MSEILSIDRHIDAIRLMTIDREFDWPRFSNEVAAVFVLLVGDDEFDDAALDTLETVRIHVSEYLAAERAAKAFTVSGDTAAAAI